MLHPLECVMATRTTTVNAHEDEMSQAYSHYDRYESTKGN